MAINARGQPDHHFIMTGNVLIGRKQERNLVQCVCLFNAVIAMGQWAVVGYDEFVAYTRVFEPSSDSTSSGQASKRSHK